MVWYGMVWYGMVWYGMVWYGMVWYGMVWYGMVWYGMGYLQLFVPEQAEPRGNQSVLFFLKLQASLYRCKLSEYTTYVITLKTSHFFEILPFH